MLRMQKPHPEEFIKLSGFIPKWERACAALSAEATILEGTYKGLSITTLLHELDITQYRVLAQYINQKDDAKEPANIQKHISDWLSSHDYIFEGNKRITALATKSVTITPFNIAYNATTLCSPVYDEDAQDQEEYIAMNPDKKSMEPTIPELYEYASVEKSTEKPTYHKLVHTTKSPTSVPISIPSSNSLKRVPALPPRVSKSSASPSNTFKLSPSSQTSDSEKRLSLARSLPKQSSKIIAFNAEFTLELLDNFTNLKTAFIQNPQMIIADGLYSGKPLYHALTVMGEISLHNIEQIIIGMQIPCNAQLVAGIIGSYISLKN